MARIGFRKAKYNFHDGDKLKEVEEKVPEFEKVVDEKFAPNRANAELYANDSLAESDSSFIDGTITITIADDEDKFVAGLLGNNIVEDGEVTQNVDDLAPEIAYGHIIPKVYGGKHKYKVEFFPRIKFTTITSDNKTKGSSVEFSTSSIEGKVMRLESDFNGLKAGDWEKHKTFDTVEQAEEYLDKLLKPYTP